MPKPVDEGEISEEILTSIDAGLDTFGTTIKSVVYYSFKKTYGLEREDILRRPDTFQNCLHEFFGAGTKIVETAIVSSISKKCRMEERQFGGNIRNAIFSAMPRLEEESFSYLMVESIENGLANVIGKKGSEAVIRNFGLKDKAVNPEAFHQAMVSAMRESGANVLEKAIIKEIYAKYGQRFNSGSSFEFGQEFNTAKDLFLGDDQMLPQTIII
jgi:hypothetical protein